MEMVKRKYNSNRIFENLKELSERVIEELNKLTRDKIRKLCRCSYANF